jgi:PAS domain S-box-containing protein
MKRRTSATKRPARATKPVKGKAGDEQVQWLLHELQVHSEEITVQNEQLIKARAEIEQARDRYAELYDFAPVGYLSLDRRGTIHECNIAAASLIGRSREFLKRMPLATIVVAEHRRVLNAFLARAVASTNEQALRVELSTKPPHQRVLLFFTKAQPGTGSSLLFTAVMDVTTERLLEGERRVALERELVRTQELAAEVAERTRAEARVKALLERLVSVQEDERRRLARDLHDHLGQQLTAMRLALKMLKQRVDSDGARQHIDRIETLASNLDRDVDHLAWELRPPALDEFGLAPALESLVREWTQYHGVAATFAAPATPARLPRDVENHLYRIAQESLNNIAKHARATHASVALEQSGPALALTIQDNGRGFGPLIAQGVSGMGLIGLRERTALIGGEIVIDSGEGRGTSVTVRMPLPPGAA